VLQTHGSLELSTISRCNSVAHAHVVCRGTVVDRINNNPDLIEISPQNVILQGCIMIVIIIKVDQCARENVSAQVGARCEVEKESTNGFMRCEDSGEAFCIAIVTRLMMVCMHAVQVNTDRLSDALVKIPIPSSCQWHLSVGGLQWKDRMPSDFSFQGGLHHQDPVRTLSPGDDDRGPLLPD
jgi:hypothetical protein